MPYALQPQDQSGKGITTIPGNIVLAAHFPKRPLKTLFGSRGKRGWESPTLTLHVDPHGQIV